MTGGKARVVVASLEDAGGLRCVDIVRLPDGRFGFDEWRRDPEDPSGWRATGRAGAATFDSADAARDAAAAAIEWLRRRG